MEVELSGVKWSGEESSWTNGHWNTHQIRASLNKTFLSLSDCYLFELIPRGIRK